MWEIFSNFVAFLENLNFKKKCFWKRFTYKKAKNSDINHEGANKESVVENESNEDLHENNDLETIKVHDNPEFMCKICGKDFAGPATLKVGFFFIKMA